MIIDKMENISNYTSVIPEDVLTFLKNMSKDIVPGRYEFSNDNFVNVETYNTKTLTDAKFEAHKKYADVQVLLSGQERIYYTKISSLTNDVVYNQDKDIMFYPEPVLGTKYEVLDGTNFMFLAPEDAHAPQVCVDNQSEPVKKVVAKIKIV